ncbi:MAG: PSP1 domain-containing protein [Gemmatimonadaceae bacterium]
MEHLIEVAFKGNRREFFRWAFEAPPPVAASIIVDVERGEDLGRVHATGELAERRKTGTTHGKEQREPLRAALRLATADDIARAEALRADDEAARRFAVQKARALNLQMKVSDAEWQWDRRRLTFYFTAEERVDFRTLVRQLEAHFSVRVQMWHIGPRDEAKRLDGVGHCGRQLCSAAWLPELLPVKTSLAKEQRLSTITPTQISGACGRLMCCLRYEHEFYVQARKRFPKQGKIVQTLAGEEKVDATDIFRDLVTLRNPAGDVRTIPLAQFKRELAGEAMPVEDEGREPDDEAADDGEEVERTPSSPRAVQRPARPPRPEMPVQLQRQPRGDPRNESRGDQRVASRDATRPEPRRDTRPAGPQSPAAETRTERIGGAANAGARGDARTPRTDPMRESRPDAPPRPDVPPRPDDTAPGAAPGAARLGQPMAPEGQQEAASDADQRRGRRRRGRRGGRRHRGDRGPGGAGSNGTGADGAPPSNPNH